MKITEMKIGQKVRFENQKWIGIVQDIRNKFNEVAVIFEGDGELEFIDAKYLHKAY
jgi:heat shock protein HspQ